MKDPIKVLFAEDDEFVCRVYKQGLENAGLVVEIATDGQKALDSIRHNKPDLVLLDLLMPVKSGFDVLQEVQHDAHVRGIPIVILTNLSQNSDKKECMRLGALDYLVKGDYTPKDIGAKIKKWVTDKDNTEK